VVFPATFAGPAFGPCVILPERRHAPPAKRELDGLRLDPTDPRELDRIVGLQQDLVRTGELLRAVILLDVPPGLQQRAILRWRARFDSSYAAASHPWLRRPSPWPDGPLHDVNPAAVAAGILARTERRYGVPHGPANEPAARIVEIADRVDRQRHDELHAAGIDVFRVEPDAVWLTAARTLSAERSWRQLSVRRVVSMIERSVEHQLQWTVFEPNGLALRSSIARLLEELLGGLFLAGAFAGATPAESYFVRVAKDLHEVTLESDAGQLVCEIGVAPVEPLEYIVVRVDRDAEGTLRAGVAGG
jgi:phage tail sheath protein FI